MILVWAALLVRAGSREAKQPLSSALADVEGCGVGGDVSVCLKNLVASPTTLCDPATLNACVTYRKGLSAGEPAAGCAKAAAEGVITPDQQAGCLKYYEHYPPHDRAPSPLLLEKCEQAYAVQCAPEAAGADQS